jgi:diketogulonate reductase-like aldo/keto reductase
MASPLRQPLGFGLYKVPPSEAQRVALSALEAGYTLLDTAQVYGNEAETGAALAAFRLAHPEAVVSVTTKVWRLATPQPAGAAFASVQASIAASRAALGVPIDLLLLHAPGMGGGVRAETWAAMEAAVAEGSVRSLGVSNFSEAHLAQLLASCKVRPVANQIEVHPWLQRRELCAFCASQGIAVEAYSPLAKAACLDDEVVAGIAARLAATPAQVLLAWSLAKGYRPLVKSVSAARQRENLGAASLALSAADMQLLDGLESGFVTGWDPVTSDPV